MKKKRTRILIKAEKVISSRFEKNDYGKIVEKTVVNKLNEK